jgi:RNA polymerase sigma-70 factor (ECF subfamily)
VSAPSIRLRSANRIPLVMTRKDSDPPSSAGEVRASGMPEGELVRAAQGGSAAAFGGLVRLHQRRAYAVARSIVGTHEDAEDVVQDAFLHAWRALDRFITGQPFGAWVNRITANAALDLTRRRKVRATDELPAALSNPFVDPAERGELKSRLAEAIAGLNERQRSVVLLHDVEGFQHAEIGELLGIPEGTCRSDLHHARSALRRALQNLRGER